MPEQTCRHQLTYEGKANDWHVSVRLDGAYIGCIHRTTHKPTGLGTSRYNVWTASIAGAEMRSSAFGQIKQKIAAHVEVNLEVIMARQAASQCQPTPSQTSESETVAEPSP
jgi:hypothetical protein